jgi:hypothetical protein
MPDNAFLGRPALSKFMEISHYAYLVLKIPGPHSVISIRGDAKRDYDYDRESCDRPWLSPPPRRPDHTRGQDLQDIHPDGGLAQQNYPIIHGGAFQGCSRGQ